MLHGHFTDCSPMELWDLPADGFTVLADVSLLGDEASKYPSCDADSVGSVVLRDTKLNTATVAYYTGNSSGSRACFVCDEASGYAPNTTTNERDCQTDKTWSRSSLVCGTLRSSLRWYEEVFFMFTHNSIVHNVLCVYETAARAMYCSKYICR